MNLKDQIIEQIEGLLFISESEAEWQLLEWPDVKDPDSLMQQVAEDSGQSIMKLQVLTPDDFMAGIHRMADPADPVMMEYLHRYTNLFTLLRAQLRDLSFIRAGAGTIHLYVAGFTDESCLALTTTAIET